MHKTLEIYLENTFNIEKIGPIIEKVLFIMKGRSDKYGRFGFSRKEWNIDQFKGLGVTEKKLRFIIERLYKSGIINKEYTFREKIDGIWICYNVYTLSNSLKNIFLSLRKGVDNINEKIIDWCKNQNPVEILRSFGLNITSGFRIGNKNSKITVNKRTGSIVNWKDNKRYNLFNFLREQEKQGILEFYYNFIG